MQIIVVGHTMHLAEGAAQVNGPEEAVTFFQEFHGRRSIRLLFFESAPASSFLIHMALSSSSNKALLPVVLL